MLKNKRNLVLDLFDYSGNKLCSLYDNTVDAVGQAVNVFVNAERNGWKELNFVLPDVADGEENFRIKSLKADYRIRLIDDDGIDWFIVSEPKITHNDFSKSVSVTAGHISQILKTKNLGLEFNDNEGNNIGTAAQLLAAILDGTGWTVGAVSKFYEKDGTTEKTRSLSAAAKTGAFSLVAKMCELFDAKPVYHGNEKTVDILPLNPFSLAANGLPDVADGNVLELHYGNNLKNVTRTMNTENMFTKLYAYGSFGDDVTGYCGIDEIKHKVLYFPSGPAMANREYKFSYTDDAGMTVTKYFICGVNGNTKNITYSLLDPASRMYVYDSENNKAYLVYDTPKQASQLTVPSVTIKEEKNMFSFIMDFDYYKENDMLNDDMLQAIARYQAKAPALLEASNAAMTSFAEKQTELSNIIGTVDFCKLDVKSYGKSGSYVTLTLNKTTEHPDGVVYRTDYDKKKDKQFKWRVADAIKPNGDPTISGASVVYIVHNTNPVTWEKVCLKAIDNTDNPSVLTIWSTNIGNSVSTDRIYIFQTDNINGYLGAYESANEANITALESSTKVVTTKHDVVFSGTTPSVPSVYGWWWNTSSHLMYFCYAEEGDTSWKRVYIDKNTPSVVNGAYFYNYEKNVLYHGVSGSWIAYETAAAKRLASTFGSVWFSCMSRDKTYDGIYSKYEKTGTLVIGKYAIYNNYGSYWVFSTDTALGSGDKLSYDTTKQYITATIGGVDKTYEAKTYRFDSVKYHKANIVADASISDGLIDQTTGADKNGTGKRTSYMRAYPNVSYSASGYPSGTTIFFYDEKYNLLSKNTIAATNTSPNNTRYIRICSANNIANTVIRFSNYNNSIIIDEDTYIVLSGVNGTGQLKGIIPFMGLFPTVADETYGVYRKAVDDAQAAVKALESEMNEALGDILREGYWQKADYVDGDEQKLYDDALENIEKISQPDVKYTIDYLDLYGADDNIESDNMSVKYHWPDVNTATAVHLVDPDIDTNTWAFVDKVQKCYDEPWKTQISINTNLSLIAQHTFTDVMKHIAEVASELNAKQTKYDKAVIQNGQGGVAADILQGQIDANTLKITGGSSTWYTDDKGNMIFVSADGMSAMTLTGNGFAIANSKNEWGDWNWRSFGTGDGFTADEIMTGVLRAGAVTILGSEQFYWDSNNIYIFDPTNQNRQIRIGQYNGADYGIGVTQDGGQTWQHAVDFDGVKFSGGIDDINGLRAVLDIQNEAISSKVSQTEFNELGDKVTDVESSVTQTASEIRAEVKNNVDGLQSQIDLVPGMISTEVSKTNIGGSNLLAGTENTWNIVSRYKTNGEHGDLTHFEYGDDYPDKRLRITDSKPSTTERYGIKLVASNLIVNNTYTFSANVKNYGNKIRISVDSLNGEYETWGDPEIRRMSYTFKATKTSHALYVCCLWGGGTKDTCFDVWKLKLEAGSNATAWENSSELSTRITQTENDITLKADATTVTNLGTKITTAEQNISALDGKISSKVSQTDFNELGRRVSTAESEISQTPNKITAAVKAIDIGGANLLLGTRKTIDVLTGGNSARTEKADGEYPDKFVEVSNSTDKEFEVYTIKYDCVVGQEYTFSVDVIAHNNKIRLRVNTTYSSWQTWGDDVKRLSVTFTATQAEHWLRVVCEKSGAATTFAKFDVRKFKLEYGNMATAWRESDEEFRAGSTIEMTKDKVSISTPEFNVDLPGANDLHMDKDGATMGNLAITGDLFASFVARRKGSKTYEVGSGKSYTTLSQVASELNNSILTGDVNIYLTSDVYDTVTFGGISGNGVLYIKGRGHTLYGSITLNNCSTRIGLYGLKVTVGSSSTTSAVHANGCCYVAIMPETVSGTTYSSVYRGAGDISQRSAIRANYGTTMFIDNTEIYGGKALIWVTECSTLLTNNLKGKECTSFIYAYGSTIYMRGTRPYGTFDTVHSSVSWPNVTSPADLTTLTVAQGSNGDDIEETGTATVTTNENTARTNYGTGGSWQSKTHDSRLFTGIYNSQSYRAVYWFSNSDFSGKVIKSATLTLTRASGSGVGGTVDIHLWGTPLAYSSADNPGNPNTSTKKDYDILGTLLPGETKEFTLKTEIAQAIASGAIKALIVDPGDETMKSGKLYSANYTKLEKAATLKVVYVK